MTFRALVAKLHKVPFVERARTMVNSELPSGSTSGRREVGPIDPNLLKVNGRTSAIRPFRRVWVKKLQCRRATGVEMGKPEVLSADYLGKNNQVSKRLTGKDSSSDPASVGRGCEVTDGKCAGRPWSRGL